MLTNISYIMAKVSHFSLFQASKSKTSTEGVVVNCQYSMATFSTGKIKQNFTDLNCTPSLKLQYEHALLKRKKTIILMLLVLTHLWNQMFKNQQQSFLAHSFVLLAPIYISVCGYMCPCQMLYF